MAAEEARPWALSGAAGEDGVFEVFRLQTTALGGGICVGGLLGSVGCQITLSGTHLVDPSCDKLAHAPKGPRVEDGG